ncbi:MAG TPA: winged helix DNA-binding domain-containing protein [Chryseosolibacter sp.]
MTTTDLLKIRLHNQQLSQNSFSSAAEVVEWMGAVQAQDYLGALWSLGMRLPATTESEVEKAVADRTIIRTWPMRGTLHFVSPKDIRWMLKYLAVRVQSKVASVFRKEGLDKKQFIKAMKLWEKALAGGKALTREEMYDVLEKGKLSSKGIRGLLMLGVAAQEGVLCFGARQGKQQTLVLLDEWIPNKQPELSKEEAMRRLAEIYVRSHGPVLPEDLAWWSGLSKTEATSAIKSLGELVISEKSNGKSYWLFPAESSGKSKSVCALLPTYDEFGIAYKDRSPIIHKTDLKQVGGVFTSGIMHNGKITGVWRRELEKEKVKLDIKPFAKYSAAQKKAVTTTIKAYGKFVGLKPDFKL